MIAGERPTFERDDHVTLADGRTLAFLELGDPGGAPAMYFHGVPGSRLEGRLATDAARSVGVRVIAPDRPGFGGSSFQRRRTIAAWPADVAELADRLGLSRFAVIGVSGGGPYALACAARMPRRVTGVALVAALGRASGRGLTRGMLMRNRLALALAGRAPAAARIAIGLAARAVRSHPERFVACMQAGAPAADRKLLGEGGYRALFAQSTPLALRRGGRGVARDLTLLARAWDFRLEEVRAPVSLWHGLADNIVPAAMARALAAALPRSALHCFAGEGHLSLIVRRLDAALADCRTWA